jgi:hypothetical protein
MRRIVLAVGVSLAMVMGGAACSDDPKRQDGNAAPAGSPSRAESPAVAPGTPEGAPSQPVTSRSATPVGPSSLPRCRTGQLRGDIEQFEPAGQAGSMQDAWLSLTNTGAPCTMSGFVGLQLLTASGQRRETTVVRSERRAQQIILGTGQTAWTVMEWRFMAAPDEQSTCAPKADAVLVTPPGESDALRVVENIRVICRHGEIFLHPMSPAQSF